MLDVLAEVEFIRIFKSGKTITKITPNIPIFDDVYKGLGQYAEDELTFNEHEEAAVSILASLYDAPRNVDSLYAKLGMDKRVFDRCIALGSQSGIVAQHTARGKKILISSFYFSDNLDGLADIVAGAGTPALQSTLKKVKDNQGWPLSLVASTGEIGGTKLSTTEAQLVHKLAAEGIVKPPTIKFGAQTRVFSFHAKARVDKTSTRPTGKSMSGRWHLSPQCAKGSFFLMPTGYGRRSVFLRRFEMLAFSVPILKHETSTRIWWCYGSHISNRLRSTSGSFI